jgi:DNA-binding CsgD family transcriptional regulator
MIEQTPELTPLEKRVLLLIAERRTNVLIKERLGLSPRQYGQVLRSLYRKSGIHRSKEPFIPSEVRQRLAQWGLDYFIQEQEKP